MTFEAHDFAGEWTLHRTIRDHLNGQHGVLAGQVVFTPRDRAHLTYDEAGTLTLENGVALEATRQYHWAFVSGEVVVSFEDGRPFHSFVPDGHAAGTDHPCGDDYYTVRYDFTNWPQWTAIWAVKGPRKDYTSTTTYTPVSAI